MSNPDVPRTKDKKICEVCGEEFSAQDSRGREHKFCSRRCSGIYQGRVGKGKIYKRYCEQCRKIFFDRKLKKTGKFFKKACCAKCAQVLQWKHREGKRKTTESFGRSTSCYRAIIEEQIGRRLKSDEVVHHLDLNPENNSLDNLWIYSKKEHDKMHMVLKNLAYEKLLELGYIPEYHNGIPIGFVLKKELSLAGD